MSEKLNSQERILVIVGHLEKSHVSGITNKELAGLVGTSEANICRDMAILDRYGWTVKNESGRRRLSPAFGGIAGRIMHSYREVKLRLTEEEAQYASEMQ
jgi:predicted DNA-binding transcriptional regulator YafY